MKEPAFLSAALEACVQLWNNGRGRTSGNVHGIALTIKCGIPSEMRHGLDRQLSRPRNAMNTKWYVAHVGCTNLGKNESMFLYTARRSSLYNRLKRDEKRPNTIATLANTSNTVPQRFSVLKAVKEFASLMWLISSASRNRVSHWSAVENEKCYEQKVLYIAYAGCTNLWRRRTRFLCGSSQATHLSPHTWTAFSWEISFLLKKVQ